MLSRKFRATREEIEETVKRGSTISGDLLYAKLSKGEGKNGKFSIIVPKKSEKSSVGRHLIKRRISADLESAIQKSNDFKKTLIIFANKAKIATSYEEIKKDLEKILQRAGLLS